MLRSHSTAQLWSTFLGNIFEHYDTALFGLLIPFLAPVLFPGMNSLYALILTYAFIPLGMLARPIGSLAFGYIGDYYGRKQALCLSLFGMGVISGLIAFMPLSPSMMFGAPLLMSLGRILQNFFAAGESMGGALFLIEKTKKRHHDLISGLFGASTIAGILLASLGVSILSYFNYVVEGWRMLYLFGCVTALFGLILRRQIPENRLETASKQAKPRFWLMLRSLWTYRRALFFIAVASGFSYSCYSIALVLTNGLIPLVSDMTQSQVTHLNTGLMVLDFLTIPLFGLLGQRFTRQKMMTAAAIFATISGIPLFMLLEGGSFLTILIVRVLFVLIGVWFSATLHSWCQELVPAAHRYGVISFGYAMGVQLLGAPTAAISLWLFHQTDAVIGAALYWVALGMLSSFVIVRSKMQKTKDLTIEFGQNSVVEIA